VKHLLVLLAAGAAVWAQHAGNANEHYRTPEQRARLARAMSDCSRDERQKPRELTRSLRIRRASRVFDLGCGPGYMEPYLSEAVGPKGLVLAEDVRPDFLEVARRAARTRGLANVEFVLGETRNPRLPRAWADLVLILDTYHHFDDPPAVLAAVRRGLAAEGRLVVVDYYKRPGAIPGMDAVHHIRADRDQAVAEIVRAGFRLTGGRDHIPASQWVAEFVAR
jgi:ubiquinone/menaquinone biosynthesis C-methylase UbiE